MTMDHWGKSILSALLVVTIAVTAGCASTTRSSSVGFRPVFAALPEESPPPPPPIKNDTPAIWPAVAPEAEVSSGFGMRGRTEGGRGRLHKGVDILAPRRSPVVATADGVVSFSGQMRGYGNVVAIDHQNGIETWYAHLNRIDVQEGWRLKQGDTIGLVGMTGNASTPHVHYEVRVDGAPVDPLPYLP